MAILQIPITKAGKGVTFSVDTDEINELPAEVFARIVEEGMKVLLNSRMSKLEAPSKLEGAALESLKAKALELAEKNLSDLKAGKLVKRSASAKASTVDRAVMTEALRLAKEVVKNEIRKAGEKPSHYAASQITAMAKEVLEADDSYLVTAKANIDSRTAIVVPKITIQKPDAKKVAKLEADKAAKKTQLSAKQAGLPGKGKVPPRKPMTAAQAEGHHTAH